MNHREPAQRVINKLCQILKKKRKKAVKSIQMRQNPGKIKQMFGQ